MAEAIWQGVLDAGLFIGVLSAVAWLLAIGQRLNHRWLQALHGYQGLLILALPGTVIHELSHAVACLLFGHRIRGMSLFRPNPASGSLGYVEHAYQVTSLYQTLGNFFIGLAPFLGGGLVLAVLCERCLQVTPVPLVSVVVDSQGALPGADFVVNPGHWVTTLSRMLYGALRLVEGNPWGGALVLYVMLSVSSHIAPSRSDFFNAGRGAFSVALLFCLVSVLIAALGVYGNLALITSVQTTWSQLHLGVMHWALGYGSVALGFQLISLLVIGVWSVVVFGFRMVHRSLAYRAGTAG